MARTLNDVERENPNASISLISKLIEYRADDSSLRRTRVQAQTDNTETISIPDGQPTGSTQNSVTSATSTQVTDPNKVSGTIPPSSTDSNANTFNEKFLKPGEEPSGSYKINMNDWGIGQDALKVEKEKGYQFGKEYVFIKCSGDNPNTVVDQRKKARLFVDQIKNSPYIFDNDGKDKLDDAKKTYIGKYIKGQFTPNEANPNENYEYIGDDVCPIGEEVKKPAPPSSAPTNIVIKTDTEEKEQVKEKAAETPQSAPAVVDNSNAMTEEKEKEIEQAAFQSTAKGEGWFVFDYMETPQMTQKMIDDSALLQGKKYWIVRRKPSDATNGAQQNEKNLAVGPALGSVPYYVGADNKKMQEEAPIAGGIQSMIDVPLFLNFPSVGVWNKAIPYMASGAGGRWPTEQLAIIQSPSIPWYNMGDWGIGNGSNPSDGTPRSSWNENQWWCGAGSSYYTKAGKYTSPHGSPVGVPAITAQMMTKCAAQCSKMHPGRIYTDANWDWGFLQVPVIWAQWANGNKGGNVVNGPYHTLNSDGWKNAYSSGWLMQNRKNPTPIVTPWKDKGAFPSAIKGGGSAAVFIAGVHYSGGTLTDAGKALWRVMTTGTTWEVAFIYNLSHVETVIWADPNSATGRMYVMAGNCGPTYDDGGPDGFTNDGGSFAVKEINAFSNFGNEHNVVAFSRLNGGNNKVSKGLGAKFKSTPAVKDFISKVKAGTDKNLIKNKPKGLKTPSYYEVLQDICQL
jgi:hypothetical protein